jgi:hypothetical protein
MPAPMRSTMPSPSQYPQSALLPRPPSLRSRRKWWKLSLCSPGWNWSGLRSKC